MPFTQHQIGDFIYWAFFFIGECMWVFVCAVAAIRAKQNPIRTRREYLYRNWDIYFCRIFTVELLLYVGWRHVGMNGILKFAHIPWLLPVEAGAPGAGGPSAAFAFGLAADALINAFAHSNKCPEILRKFLTERIPEVPQQVPVGDVETKTTFTPTDPTQPVTETSSVSHVTGPAVPLDTKEK